MGFVHGFQRGKKFLRHLNLVFEGSVGVICIVKGGEGGLVDNLFSEGKVRGFVRVEFIQLLYSGKGQGGFGRGVAVFRHFGFKWWCLLVTSAGISISKSMTPGNMVVDIG